MVRTLIFDFDGVICDSQSLVHSVFNSLAPLYGCRVIKDDGNLRMKSLTEHFRQQGLKRWKIPLLLLHMRYRLYARFEELKPFPSMIETLRLLIKEGYEIRIFTSNSARLVKRFLDDQQLAVTQIHAGIGLFSKPKKLLALKQQCSPDLLYFGDEPRDIEAAQYADISGVAVTWGYSDERLLRQYQPAYSLNKPAEIISLLLELSGKSS